LTTLAGLLMAGWCFAASAEEYPSRQITLIVPYPPAGGVDAMARIVAEKLSVALAQQVVVAIVGAGGGNIGTVSSLRRRPTGTRRATPPGHRPHAAMPSPQYEIAFDAAQ
jgi:tripartite-type tricarboxylate transporter receptor subunit TctC